MSSSIESGTLPRSTIAAASAFRVAARLTNPSGRMTEAIESTRARDKSVGRRPPLEESLVHRRDGLPARTLQEDLRDQDPERVVRLAPRERPPMLLAPTEQPRPERTYPFHRSGGYAPWKALRATGATRYPSPSGAGRSSMLINTPSASHCSATWDRRAASLRAPLDIGLGADQHHLSRLPCGLGHRLEMGHRSGLCGLERLNRELVLSMLMPPRSASVPGSPACTRESVTRLTVENGFVCPPRLASGADTMAMTQASTPETRYAKTVDGVHIAYAGRRRGAGRPGRDGVRPRPRRDLARPAHRESSCGGSPPSVA